MADTQNNKTRINRILLLFVLSLLFIYIVYRAYHMAITLDEAYSYGITRGNKVTANTANNHFLNTFLMALCSWLFGSSELSLRLPNICGFLMYGFACFQLLKNQRFFIVLAGIAILLLNPYLLDYFSLARGYGLAIGFFMVSLLNLLKAIKASALSDLFKNGAITLLFSTAACLSNLTYINANLILLLILFISYLRLKKAPAGSRNMIVFFVTAIVLNFVCLAALVHELLKLRDAKELYFGGTTGFIHDTLNELVHSSMYFSLSQYNEVSSQIICWFAVALFLIILAYVLFTRRYNKLAVVTIFLSLMIAAPIVQFMLLDTRLPFGRTSLIYIPLMGICVCFFMEELLKKNLKKITLYAIFALQLFIFIPSSYNFAVTVNPAYCYDANFNMYTKEAMGIINTLYHGKERATIMYASFLGSGINYYKERYSMDYLVLAGESKKMADEDILLLLNNEKEQMKDLSGYNLVKQYTIINYDCFLYVKKESGGDKKELCRGDINLKARNNQYLCCEGNQHIIANKQKMSTWETFSFIAYPNNECALKSYEGFYICADLGSHAETVANRPEKGAWELFHYIDLGGGYYAFKAANDKYLSFDSKTLQIFATADLIGPSEKFELINNPVLYDTGNTLKGFLQHSTMP